MMRRFIGLLSILLIFSLPAGTVYAEDEPPVEETPGETTDPSGDFGQSETTITSDYWTTGADGKPVYATDEISYPDGTDYGSSGGMWTIFGERILVGCREVSITNKKWNYSHTQVLAKFKTDTYWCFDTKRKVISNVRVQWDTDIASMTFMEKVGISHDDRRFYDWASGIAPKSGYDNDLEYHFKNCPLNWSCGHLYLRNIFRAHSDGSYTWRTEN